MTEFSLSSSHGMMILYVVTILAAFALSGFAAKYLLLRHFVSKFVGQSGQALLVEIFGKIYVSQKTLDLFGLSNIVRFDALAACIAPKHRADFLADLARLRGKGATFDATMDLENGKVASISARSSKFLFLNFIQIWFEDISALSQLVEDYASEEASKNRLEGVLDILPMPIWLREGVRLDLVFVNQAYADLLETTKDEVLDQQMELGAHTIAQGGRSLAMRAQTSSNIQSESHSLSLGGKRHLLDYSEVRLSRYKENIAGFAADLTQLDNLQAQLVRHLAVHDDVLDNMKAAITIFGPDKRLTYYNNSFLRLFSLQSSDISGGPSFSEVLDTLRHRRQLPEVIDFPQYKREREALFSRLIEKEDIMLHLPDGRTLQQFTVPHPLGGLMMMLEDVTDILTLETSFNTQIAVQQATLDNLPNAISVWGSDGRLKISNKAFEEIWQISGDALEASQHISEVASYLYKRWLSGIAIEMRSNPQQRLILQVLNREATTYNLDLNDGRVIRVSLVPLPDAQVMLINTDVTDTAKVER
ncbi:MAG: PAS-domain containing protein, partial [Alphaproteobacteria bacterium]|nr:PAS-domain containing protein [Alphaproteobacteria bacterium]